MLASRNLCKKIFTGSRHITSHIMNIRNFIFLDTETTGLPYAEHNKTRITEISLITVLSEHIGLGVYPRVQNKLTLCFNPQKMINPQASNITGMTNELLEYQSTFDERSCALINDFLALQRKPLCFVAHNGNHFDYPILKAEFFKAGCQLSDDILCIDSLYAFRDLDKSNRVEAEKVDTVDRSVIQLGQTNINKCSAKAINVSIYDLPTQENIPIEFCDGYDEMLYNAVEDIENKHQTKIKQAQTVNESTPKKNLAVINNPTNKVSTEETDGLYCNVASVPNENRIKNDINISCRPKGLATRKLNFGYRSYKLIDVYTRLTNKVNDNTHQAEEDVNMIIECAAVLGQEFVDWSNANAKKMSSIAMMTPGKKLGL